MLRLQRRRDGKIKHADPENPCNEGRKRMWGRGQTYASTSQALHSHFCLPSFLWNWLWIIQEWSGSSLSSFIKKKAGWKRLGVRMDAVMTQWMDPPLRRKRKIACLLFPESRVDEWVIWMEGKDRWMDEVVQVASPGTMSDQKLALMACKSRDSSFIQPKRETARWMHTSLEDPEAQTCVFQNLSGE